MTSHDEQQHPSLPVVDKAAALERLDSVPHGSLLTLDEAAFVLNGEPLPVPTSREIIRQFYREMIVGRLRAVYYRFRFRYFPPAHCVEVALDGEDIPEGVDRDDILFHPQAVELFLRRHRSVQYHPRLGMELPCFIFDDGQTIRFAWGDLRGFLMGQPFIEYEAGSTNFLNSCISE